MTVSEQSYLNTKNRKRQYLPRENIAPFPKISAFFKISAAAVFSHAIDFTERALYVSAGKYGVQFSSAKTACKAHPLLLSPKFFIPPGCIEVVHGARVLRNAQFARQIIFWGEIFLRKYRYPSP